MFFGLIAFVLLFCGETRYIIETGFSSLGRMIQNFVDLSTFTDPLRTSNFPQNWTIYYWAYWMVWCVAAPFFIGSIFNAGCFTDVQTATARDLFDVASSGSLDKFVGSLVNKRRIHKPWKDIPGAHRG